MTNSESNTIGQPNITHVAHNGQHRKRYNSNPISPMWRITANIGSDTKGNPISPMWRITANIESDTKGNKPEGDSPKTLSQRQYVSQTPRKESKKW